MLDTRAVHYVETVLGESQAPTCQFEGRISHVKDPEKCVVVRPDGEPGSFQVRPQCQDCPDLFDTFPVRGVVRPFSRIESALPVPYRLRWYLEMFL